MARDDENIPPPLHENELYSIALYAVNSLKNMDIIYYVILDFRQENPIGILIPQMRSIHTENIIFLCKKTCVMP